MALRAAEAAAFREGGMLQWTMLGGIPKTANKQKKCENVHM
jgi:hypothetical protein